MQVIDLPEPDIKSAAIGFSPDGRLLAAWTRNGHVLLLDTASGTARILRSDGKEYSYCTPGVGFTADSRSVVVPYFRKDINQSRGIQVHNTKTGKATRKFLDLDVWAMEVGTNGLVVFAGWSTKTGRLSVEFWNTQTDRRRRVIDWPMGFPEVLAVSADERWVAGSCVDLIRLWSFAGNKPPERARRQFHIDHNETVRAIVVSANGEYVAATSSALHVWDVRTGKETGIAKAKPNWGREIVFHPSKPILAYSGGTDTVTFWDAPTRDEVKRFDWKIGKVSAVAFSPDGLRCAAAGEGKVVVWDVDL